MKRPELDTNYYLQHFDELLQVITTHYQAVLSPPHQQFLDDIAGLSEPARRLWVRMANRKGEVFNTAELHYEEIGAPEPILAQLQQAGLVAPLSAPHLPDFWLRQSKDTLWKLLQFAAESTVIPAVKKSQPKPQLAAVAQQLNVDWLALINRLPQRFVALQQLDTLHYLYFLYFGRPETSLTSLALRDMQARRAEALPEHPRFTDIHQAQLAFQLANSKKAIANIDKQLKSDPPRAIAQLQNWLATAQRWPAPLSPGGDNECDAHHSHKDTELAVNQADRCYQLGKLAQKAGQVPLAIAFYQLSNCYPASQLLAQLYAQHAELATLQQYLQQLIDNPGCDEEWLFASRYYQRYFQQQRESKFSVLLSNLPTAPVDDIYQQQPLQGLANYYRQQGYQVYLPQQIPHQLPPKIQAICPAGVSQPAFRQLLLVSNDSLQLIGVRVPGESVPRVQLEQILALQQAGFNARLERIEWVIDPNRIYVVLDVETTGGRAGTDRVIEVGAVKMLHGEVIDTFSTLINPQRAIPPFISRLTGISNAMVANAPTFSDIVSQLSDFLQGTVFVAHNAKFDYGFIRSEFARLQQPFDMPHQCTVIDMRRYYPGLESYSLGNLCAEFNITLTNHHRALADATATAELLKLIEAKRTASQ